MCFKHRVHSHLQALVQHGTDRYGSIHNPMWVSSLDLDPASPSYLHYPLYHRYNDSPRPSPDPQAGVRAYREITGPWGSVIFWDIPQLSLTHHMAGVTGNTALSSAADQYVAHFIKPTAQGGAGAIGDYGLFGLGNHHYYDMFTDQLVQFAPTLVGSSARSYVEHRPLSLDWDVFWRVDPAATEAHIRGFGQRSVVGGFDTTTGQFDRHTAGGSGYSFIEAGGGLVESLTWLHAKKGGSNADLTNLAKKVAQFSYNSRNATTGLMPVQTTVERWDRHHATSEVGLWALALLKAYEYTGDSDYVTMTCDTVGAFVDQAYDSDRRRYYGKLAVTTGQPNLSTGANMPGAYTNVWNTFFPDHEYGISMGEAAARLYELTGEERFKTAAYRVALQMKEQRPQVNARSGHGAYAETFGRGIDFLLKAAEVFNDPAFQRQAQALGHEAVTVLYHEPSGMFRGHGGELRYDAVDGVGILGGALLKLGSIDVPSGTTTATGNSPAPDVQAAGMIAGAVTRPSRRAATPGGHSGGTAPGNRSVSAQ